MAMAVNLAVAGETVMVTNGIYAPITVANVALCVRSVNGAAMDMGAYEWDGTAILTPYQQWLLDTGLIHDTPANHAQ